VCRATGSPGPAGQVFGGRPLRVSDVPGRRATPHDARVRRGLPGRDHRLVLGRPGAEHRFDDRRASGVRAAVTGRAGIAGRPDPRDPLTYESPADACPPDTRHCRLDA